MKIYTEIHDDKLYVIVPDKDSGRRGRYTTYRINLTGMKSAKVIGRECPLGQSRSLR